LVKEQLFADRAEQAAAVVEEEVLAEGDPSAAQNLWL
jgi:hypothetical protein